MDVVDRSGGNRPEVDSAIAKVVVQKATQRIAGIKIDLSGISAKLKSGRYSPLDRPGGVGLQGRRGFHTRCSYTLRRIEKYFGLGHC